MNRRDFLRQAAAAMAAAAGGCITSDGANGQVDATRGVEAARVCRSTTGRYFYWMTDNGEKCNCPKCKPLSGAEQAVIVETPCAATTKIAPFFDFENWC